MTVSRLTVLIFIIFHSAIQAQMPAHKQHRSPQAYQGTSIHLGPILKANLRNDDSEIGAYQFAERRDVHLTPFNSGSWKRKEDRHIWSLAIQSELAHSLNLGFTEYHLPEGAALSIISEIGEIIGPFTKADNKDHLQLWTPIVTGDNLTIQLVINQADIDHLKLTLSAINHGFTPVVTRSGSCNIDVLCSATENYPLIDKFRDQIQSVANIQINGSFMCSGFLINTAQNDFRPYFITAAHCGLNATSARTAVFYWNFQNSMCRPVNSNESGANGDGLLNQFNTGAQIISSAVDGNLDATSVDFTLLLLDEPIDPNFKPYYAGWDIRTTPPDSSFVVHHPSGDEKRISFDFDPATFVEHSEDSVFVKVENYEIGTTESGSSGAPLFNMQGNAVGYVSGGNASCSRLDGFDEFGWLGLAFKNGNSPETRLVDWLDPNATGITSVNGLNGSFTIKATEALQVICGSQTNTVNIEIEVDKNFKSEVMMAFSNLPEGVVGSFTNISPNPGNTTELILENLNNLSSGIYTIDISGSDGENQNSNSIRLDVISSIPSTAEVIFPLENDVVNNLAKFNWNGDAVGYDIEVADNIAFINPIVEESNIEDRVFLTNKLSENQEYFWRIRGKNFCGNSAWSDPILFQTTNLNCTLFEQNDINLEITDMRDDTVDATVVIDLNQTIQFVSIPLVEGDHTWSSDLVFSIISPAGTEVTLADRLCNGNVPFADFNLGFDDQGFSRDQIPCPYTDGKIYQPEMPLSAFQGESTTGTWTLRVIDELLLDNGLFKSWHLQVCSESGLSLIPTFSTKVINGCGINTFEGTFVIPEDFQGPVNIGAKASSSELGIAFDKLSANPGETINFSIDNIDALQTIENSIRFSLSDGQQASESIVLINFKSSEKEASLIAPLNDEVFKTGSIVEFDWTDVDDVDQYTLQVSTDPAFGNIDKEVLASSSNESVTLDFITSQDPITVYWRVITADQNCDLSSDVYSFIADITDAVIPVANTELNIFPNPVSDKLTLESSGELNSQLTIELFDLSGKRLQTLKIKEGRVNQEIDMSYLTSGIYFLKVSSLKDAHVTKLIKS